MKYRVSTFALPTFAGLAALMTAAAGYAGTGEERMEHHRRDHEVLDSTRAERMERVREFRRQESNLGRMSPEERRQLRLEIRAAREGVYRQPPPPPPLVLPVPVSPAQQQ
jgi:hypothetical protein